MFAKREPVQTLKPHHDGSPHRPTCPTQPVHSQLYSCGTAPSAGKVFAAEGNPLSGLQIPGRIATHMHELSLLATLQLTNECACGSTLSQSSRSPL